VALAFIASASGTNTGTQIDCSSTLNLAVGDILVAAIAWQTGVSTVGIATTAPADSFTMLATANYITRDYQALGYVVVGTANAAATIRATMGTSRESYLSVLQFRPDAGETITLEAGPSAGSAGSGSLLQSGNISPTGNDFVVVAAGHNAAGFPLTGEQIADAAAAGYVRNGKAGIWYSFFTANQTAIHGQASFADNDSWVCDILAIKSAGEAGPTYTLTGPSGGVVGVESSNFTIAVTGTIASTIFTPSDSSGGGTFSPTSRTLSGVSPSGTFTYTPGTSGTKSISTTNDGGLTDPSPVSYVATPVGTVGVGDANLLWSPGSWDDISIGTYGVTTRSMQSATSGAYMKFRVLASTDVSILIDSSISSSIALANKPKIAYSIDGGAETRVAINGQSSIAILTGAASADRSFVVWMVTTQFDGTIRYSDTAGVSYTNGLRIQGVSHNPSGTITTHPANLTSKMLFYGDSITEGQRTVSISLEDPLLACVRAVATHMDAEYGQLGYGSQGWTTPGSAGNDVLVTWDKYSTDRQRTVTGYDYVFTMHGTNDGYNLVPDATIAVEVTAWLTAARAGFGSTVHIFVIIPPGAYAVTGITNGFNAYVSSFPADTRVHLLNLNPQVPASYFNDTGLSAYSFDGIHPSAAGNVLISDEIITQLIALGIPEGPHDIVGAGGIASGEAFGLPIIGTPVEESSEGNIQLCLGRRIRHPICGPTINIWGETQGDGMGFNTIVNYEYFQYTDSIIGAGGIASAEAFGQPTISVNVSTIGIASAEVFGQPTVTVAGTGHDIIGAGGIASSESFGQPAISATVQSAGIVSGEVFGQPTISARVSAAGIASAEAFGLPSISARISPASIPSSEVFGQPTISVRISPASIVSAESFGLPSLSVMISPTGIASAEAFGQPTIYGSEHLILDAGGISSGESFGQPSISATIKPAGIVSGEIFGNPTISVRIAPAGIPSAETFGQPVIITTIYPIGIVSGEAFGHPTISLQVIGAGGIASEESFGLPTIGSPVTTAYGKILVGGAWVDAIDCNVLEGGAWHQVTEVYVLNSGIWELVI
jgi:lysophospholipase L1-like esterase